MLELETISVLEVTPFIPIVEVLLNSGWIFYIVIIVIIITTIYAVASSIMTEIKKK